MSEHVVVVGSLNVDLVTRVRRHPAPGETVAGEGLDHLPGGKGANQAAAVAREGVRSTLVGRVGDDAAGSSYLIGLRRQGVDVSRVQRTRGTPTGHALIAVDGAGENTIVVVPGANARVTPDDVEACADVLADAAVVLVQMELPDDVVLAAARAGRAHGCTVVLNPSPVRPFCEGLAEAVDVVVVNEHEARELAPGDFAVVTTLGPRGVRWQAPDRSFEVPAHEPPPVVDTTGAGDAFAGTLCARLARGDDAWDAVHVAARAGAAAVGWPGAQGWSLRD